MGKTMGSASCPPMRRMSYAGCSTNAKPIGRGSEITPSLCQGRTANLCNNLWKKIRPLLPTTPAEVYFLCPRRVPGRNDEQQRMHQPSLMLSTFGGLRPTVILLTREGKYR